MARSPHILLVEDDAALAREVSGSLRAQGYEVTWWSVGQVPESDDFDLVVLDLMLPGLDGLTILRRLRETSETPVLVLSAP